MKGGDSQQTEAVHGIRETKSVKHLSARVMILDVRARGVDVDVGGSILWRSQLGHLSHCHIHTFVSNASGVPNLVTCHIPRHQTPPLHSMQLS